MLTYLHVKNIALIHDLEIDFSSGLNILTGETGAGKSIILGSINYVLGGKSKKDVIRRGADEAMVECVFDVSNKDKEELLIKTILEENGIKPDPNGIIISRKTAVNGRSVFRVNGEVVRQDVIRKLAGLLIDIHSQHEHQSLLSSSRQLELLDRYCGDAMDQLLSLYGELYKEHYDLMKEINVDLMDDEKRRREIAFLEFEIKEIEDANLKIGEDQELQDVYDHLSHSKDILEILGHVDQTFFGRQDISSHISSYISNISKYKDYDKALESVYESLVQIEDILTTLSRDVESFVDQSTDFEEELYESEKRLDVINQLKLKYGDSIESIFDYLSKQQDKHDSLVDYEKNLLETKVKIKSLETKLQKTGDDIHNLRVRKSKELKEQIELLLYDLNLENAQFQVHLDKQKDFGIKGFDKAEFLITTNKGEPLKPLKEVASGGELSRIMLALKSVLAEVDEVGTLIFDEVDTGISGKTAQMVAEKMVDLSGIRQLICITHLPQIASMADHHYRISKRIVDDVAQTDMVLMDEVKSLEEVGRMLGGGRITDNVYKTAQEMRDYGRKIKASNKGS